MKKFVWGKNQISRDFDDFQFKNLGSGTVPYSFFSTRKEPGTVGTSSIGKNNKKLWFIKKSYLFTNPFVWNLFEILLN